MRLSDKENFFETLESQSKIAKQVETLLLEIVQDKHTVPVKSVKLKNLCLKDLTTTQLYRLSFFSKCTRANLALGSNSISSVSAFTPHYFISHAVYYGRCRALYQGHFEDHLNVSEIERWGQQWGRWSHSTIRRALGDLESDGILYFNKSAGQKFVLSTKLNITRRGMKALKLYIYIQNVDNKLYNDNVWVEYLKYPKDVLYKCRKLISKNTWAFGNKENMERLIVESQLKKSDPNVDYSLVNSAFQPTYPTD